MDPKLPYEKILSFLNDIPSTNTNDPIVTSTNHMEQFRKEPRKEIQKNPSEKKYNGESPRNSDTIESFLNYNHTNDDTSNNNHESQGNINSQSNFITRTKFKIYSKTKLLLFPTSISNENNYYDMIDACFGTAYAAKVKNEIELNFNHLLEPGEIYKQDSNETILLSLLSNSNKIRNDNCIFLSNEMINVDATPYLHNFITCITNEVQSSILKKCNIQITRYSIQYATYDTTSSGYIRHLDAPSSSNKERRIITLIYYLNDQDWFMDTHGGGLKLYLQSNEYEVINPALDRMILFRSDKVYHEVLPLSEGSDKVRKALTIWFYTNNPNNNMNYPISFNTSIDNECDETQKTGKTAYDIKPLPIAASKKEENKTHSIFVAIASYRDKELYSTIQSLFTTAKHPNRIYVGILQQIDDTDEDIMQLLKSDSDTLPSCVDIKKQIRCLTISSIHSTGPCNARSIVYNLYRNEDFIMQADSHLQFRYNWDSYLIQCIMSSTTDDYRYSVITTYPPAYTLPNRFVDYDDTTIVQIIPWKFDSNGMLRQIGRIKQKTNDKSTSLSLPLLAAGFFFSYTKTILPILQSSKLSSLHGLFFGEEIYISCLLFCHGFQFYTPNSTVVWHLWKRNEHTPFNKDKNDLLMVYRVQSLDVVKKLLQCDDSKWDVNEDSIEKSNETKRRKSLKEYERCLGVDFKQKKILVNYDIDGCDDDSIELKKNLLAALNL